jgi:hypothetical protein
VQNPGIAGSVRPRCTVSEKFTEPGKDKRKQNIVVRFLRRMIFGIAGVAGLIWFVGHIEHINQLRGIESSRATGLAAVGYSSSYTPMLTKDVMSQMRAAAGVNREGTRIARTVSLNVSVRDFAHARAVVDQIVKSHAGYTASMTISGPQSISQSLSANIAIPSTQCDVAVNEFRAIGRIEEERQGSEEVTAQSEDLDIRLKNARETETRLTDILLIRTGKVSDVLEVEKEMARVREDIERMESEQKRLSNRVDFAFINLNLTEEYQAQLGVGPSMVGLQIRNAWVAGYHSAAEGLLGALAFCLSIGPSLLLWGLILSWPTRWVVRRWREWRSGAAAA